MLVRCLSFVHCRPASIAFTMAVIIFVATSCVEVFENHVPWFPDYVPDDRLIALSWTDCLYLMFITTTAVGYGRAISYQLCGGSRLEVHLLASPG